MTNSHNRVVLASQGPGIARNGEKKKVYITLITSSPKIIPLLTKSRVPRGKSLARKVYDDMMVGLSLKPQLLREKCDLYFLDSWDCVLST